MIKINQLADKILAYPAAGIHSRKTKGWALGIARDINRFCGYLNDVLTNCNQVRVTVEIIPKDELFPGCEVLKIDYLNGEGKILLDDIYTTFLLPEIERILQSKKMSLSTNLKLAA